MNPFSIQMDDVKSLGAMIVEEPLGFALQDFVRAVCPQQSPVQHISATWRHPKKRPSSLGIEIPFCHCTVRLEDTHMHLLSFPDALSRNFSVDDLEFPLDLEGMGFIVVLDIDSLFRLGERNLPTTDSDPRRSPLAWAFAHNLPTVVIAKGYFTGEELRDTFKVSPDTPVWCFSDFRSDMMLYVLEGLAEQFTEWE